MCDFDKNLEKKTNSELNIWKNIQQNVNQAYDLHFAF